MLPRLLQQHNEDLSNLEDRFARCMPRKAKMISFYETKHTYLFKYFSAGLVGSGLPMTNPSLICI